VKSQSKCTSTGFLLHAVFFTDAHLRRAHKLKQVWQLGAFPSIVDHTITAVGIHAGLAPTKMPSVATYAPDAPGAAQKGHKDIRTIFAKTSAPTATSRPSTKWEEHFWGDTQTPVPTTVPSVMPTFAPTSDPSDTPSVLPSSAPSLAPTTTEGPSLAPSTSAPTYVPVPCPMSASARQYTTIRAHNQSLVALVLKGAESSFLKGERDQVLMYLAEHLNIGMDDMMANVLGTSTSTGCAAGSGLVQIDVTFLSDGDTKLAQQVMDMFHQSILDPTDGSFPVVAVKVMASTSATLSPISVAPTPTLTVANVSIHLSEK